MDIIIPASGKGQRFADVGFQRSKPFIKVGEKMIIEHVLSSFPNELQKTTIFTKDQIADNRKEIKHIEKMTEIKVINTITDGPLRTLITGAKDILIKDNPILIANCDMIVDIRMSEIQEQLKTVDATLVSFVEENKSIQHWSFIQTDNEKVIRVAEKLRISNIASLGLYAFRSSSSFMESAEKTFKHGTKYNNEWYVSCMYEIFLQKYQAHILSVNKNDQISVGTPYELYCFMQSLLLRNA